MKNSSYKCLRFNQTVEQTLKTENRIELIYGLLDMFSKEEINPFIGFIILLNEFC
jgi:hypothetical protein